MAHIINTVTGEVKQVKNLGWLLRNWRDAQSITITRWHDNARWDCELRVIMSKDRVYVTPFADYSICARWIDRPVLRGLPVSIVE